MPDTIQYLEEITLDINTNRAYVVVSAKQNDTGRKIKVTLQNNGANYSVASGHSVVFRCRKPDGFAILDWAERNNDGTVTITLTAQTLAVAGRAYADVIEFDGDISSIIDAGIINNTTRLSTACFILNIMSQPKVATRMLSANEFQIFEDCLKTAQVDVNAVAADVSALEARASNIAPHIDVTTISGGHKVTVTDYYHSDTFDIADGQGLATVDNALSSTSLNPVQNKIIYEALNNAISLSDVVAAAYSSTTYYYVGSHCSYDGKVYRCITATPSAGEAWNSAHWVQVKLGSDYLDKGMGGTIHGSVAITSGGQLFITSNNIVDGTAPSTGTWAEGIQLQDAANNIIGRVSPAFYSNGDQGLMMRSRRDVSGTNVEAAVEVGANALGSSYIHLTGPVSDFRIYSDSLVNTVAPSVDKFGASIQLVDANRKNLGVLCASTRSDGRQGLVLSAQKTQSATSTIWTGLEFGVNSSNVPYVQLYGGEATASAFRSAFGLESLTTITTVSNVITVSSGFSISSVVCQKLGKTVQICLNATKTESALTTAGEGTVGTIVSTLRPYTYFGKIGGVPIQKDLVYTYLNTQDGAIKVYGAWPSNETRSLFFTYLVP